MTDRAPGDLELTATRRLPFPAARVWTACTTKSTIEQWWSPEDLRTTVRRLEVRPGGEVLFRVRYVPALLTPGSKDVFRAARIPIAFDLRGKLSEVVLERILTFDLTLDIGKAGTGVEMITKFELNPDGDGTWVKLIARGKETPHWTTLGQQTLEAQLERLEGSVASQGGR